MSVTGRFFIGTPKVCKCAAKKDCVPGQDDGQQKPTRLK